MKSSINNCWIKDNNIKVSFLVSIIWGLIRNLYQPRRCSLGIIQSCVWCRHFMKYFSLISFSICHHDDKAKLLLCSCIWGALLATIENFNQLLSINIVIIIITSIYRRLSLKSKLAVSKFILLKVRLVILVLVQVELDDHRKILRT